MFSRIFIERPRFAIVISVVMVLAGILCINKLPIAEYPEIAPPSIVVSATYTGASAQVVADTVALPIEDQINGVEDLLYYSSTSDNSGNYQCTITFKTGIDSDIAMVNVQNAIKRAEPKLPEDVMKVGVTVQQAFERYSAFRRVPDGRQEYGHSRRSTLISRQRWWIPSDVSTASPVRS